MKYVKLSLIVLLILLAVPIVAADSQVYIDSQGNSIKVTPLKIWEKFSIAGQKQLVNVPGFGNSGFEGPVEVSSKDIKFGQRVTISVLFHAATEADYFLEGGTLYWTTLNDPNPFGNQLIVGVDQNSCNPSETFFSSKLIRLPAGTHRIEFSVRPNGPGERTPKPKAGYYGYQVAWVKGCGQGSYDFRASTNPNTNPPSATGLIKVTDTTTGTTGTTTGTTTTSEEFPLQTTKGNSGWKVSLGTGGFTASPLSISETGTVTVSGSFFADKKGTYFLQGNIGKIGEINTDLRQLVVGSNTCDPGDLNFANGPVQLDRGFHKIDFTLKPTEGIGAYSYATSWVDGCGNLGLGNVLDEQKSEPLTNKPRILVYDSKSNSTLPEGLKCSDISLEVPSEKIGMQRCNSFSACVVEEGKSVGTGGGTRTIKTCSSLEDAAERKEIKECSDANNQPTFITGDARRKAREDDCAQLAQCVYIPPGQGHLLDPFGQCVAKTCDHKVSFTVDPIDAIIKQNGNAVKSGVTSLNNVCSNDVFTFEKKGFRTYTLALKLKPGQGASENIKLFSDDISCVTISPDTNQNFLRSISPDTLECNKHAGCVTAVVPKSFDTTAISTAAIASAGSRFFISNKLLTSKKVSAAAAKAAGGLVGGVPGFIATSIAGFAIGDLISPDEKFICLDTGPESTADKVEDFLSSLGNFAKIGAIVLIVIISIILLLGVLRLITRITR